MSDRNAGSCEPSFSRSVSVFGWTVRNPGPRRGSTTATTTFEGLGVSYTIPSRAGPAPATLTRSPIAAVSTTRAYRAQAARLSATAATAGRPPVRSRLTLGCQRSRLRVTTAAAEPSDRCRLVQSGQADDPLRSSRRPPSIAADPAKTLLSPGPQMCSPTPSPPRAGRRSAPRPPWRRDPSESTGSAYLNRTPRLRPHWPRRRAGWTSRPTAGSRPGTVEGSTMNDADRGGPR